MFERLSTLTSAVNQLIRSNTLQPVEPLHPILCHSKPRTHTVCEATPDRGQPRYRPRRRVSHRIASKTSPVATPCRVSVTRMYVDHGTLAAPAAVQRAAFGHQPNSLSATRCGLGQKVGARIGGLISQ